MSMYPTYTPQLRPTASQTAVVVETGKDTLLEFFGVDSQKILAIAGVAATVGIGSAILYYGSKKRGGSDDDGKKRSRVSFKTPDEKEESNTTTTSDKQQVSSKSSLSKVKQDENANPVAVPPPPPLPPRENKLVLKQCPRGRKTPCIAPFPLKLETFLRVHGIKYELDFNGHEPKLYGSPWIRFNTEDITDSQNVIQFLVDAYNINLERELMPEQRAVSTAYAHLLENHLYWGIALWRWVYDGARSLKEIQLLPKKIQQLIPDVCKTVAQAAWFHGIGKMTPTDVKKAVLKDLASLSEFLGKKKYFLDTDVPTELDCTAFGMLAQFLWNMKGPFHDAVLNNHQNLREFCWRMRQTYWPDWEDCLNNKDFYTNDPYPVAQHSLNPAYNF